MTSFSNCIWLAIRILCRLLSFMNSIRGIFGRYRLFDKFCSFRFEVERQDFQALFLVGQVQRLNGLSLRRETHDWNLRLVLTLSAISSNLYLVSRHLTLQSKRVMQTGLARMVIQPNVEFQTNNRRSFRRCLGAQGVSVKGEQHLFDQETKVRFYREHRDNYQAEGL